MKTKTTLAGLLVALAALATAPGASADGSCDTADVGTGPAFDNSVSTQGDCGVHVDINNPSAQCTRVDAGPATVDGDCDVHVIV